jgi:hypothetical protein
MSNLDTLPSSIDVGTNEIAIYNFDVTDVLGTGESLQSNPAPTAQLISNANNAAVSNVFIGAPGVSGNIVQINFNCLVLKPKQTYALIVTYYTTPTKRLQFRTQVNVIL